MMVLLQNNDEIFFDTYIMVLLKISYLRKNVMFTTCSYGFFLDDDDDDC